MKYEKTYTLYLLVICSLLFDPLSDISNKDLFRIFQMSASNLNLNLKEMLPQYYKYSDLYNVSRVGIISHPLRSGSHSSGKLLFICF